MISDLNLTETIEFNFVGALDVPQIRSLDFLGRARVPWKYITGSGTVTTGAAIMIISLIFRNENGILVKAITMLPWMFANTINFFNASMASPIFGSINFLGQQFLASTHPQDFYVLPEWTMEYTVINALPGSFADMTMIFEIPDSDDKY